jgi:AsmA protein
VLERPVINLEIDSQGRPNWEFASAEAGGKPAAPAVPAGQPDRGGDGAALRGLQLGDVRLVDGRLTYRDARSGVEQVVDDIDMSVSLPSLASPMAADGSLVWNKEKIALKLGMENPKAFLTGDTTRLAASVSAAPVKLEFEGTASQGKQIKAAGTVDLDVPSLRKLAAWAGQPLSAPGEGYGPLRIGGTIGVEGQKYRFTKAKFAFDKIEASGEFHYDGGGRRPHLQARLDTGVLDLNPYLPPEAPPAGGASKPAAGSGGGAAPQQGWSDDPIDLTPLRQVDVDAVMQAEGVVVRKIAVGKSRVKVGLKDGRLSTELTEMALYRGGGKAVLTADASADTPVVAMTLDVSGLQANPALKDAADFERIEGTLNTKLDVKTRGRSQREMVQALNGSGMLAFKDGAIRGINLGAMIRNVRQGLFDPKAGEQQKTDFTELSGTFRITDGILSNGDLALLSPLLRVTGKGTVDLPRKTLDYRIQPKLAPTTQGQGGKAEVAGISVPVIVSGPWDNPSYRPDLAGAVEGIPAEALDKLKEMMPGVGKPDGSSDGGKSGSSPADTLKKLFGR